MQRVLFAVWLIPQFYLACGTPLKKLGAYVMQAGETSPVVWQGRTVLLQIVSGTTPGLYPCCTWCGSKLPADWKCTEYSDCSACTCSDYFKKAYGSCVPEYIQLVDFKTLEVLLPMIPGSQGFGFASAFVHGGSLWVYGTNLVNNTRSSGSAEISCFSSADPFNVNSWRQSLAITMPPGYAAFNTDAFYVDSSDPAFPNRKFVMAIEVNSIPGTQLPGFASVFAATDSSTPDRGWMLLDTATHSFGKKAYAACPTIRFYDGFYYIATTITGPPCPPSGTHGNFTGSFCVIVARSRSLNDEDWTWGNRGQTILAPDDLDRQVLPQWHPTQEQLDGIRNGPLTLGNINDSDFDFCDTDEGVLGVFAGIANQQSNPYFSIATIVPGQTTSEWLSSMFPAEELVVL